MEVVLDFFKERISLHHINSTFITLIPKSKDAQKLVDFRPILCANILYKIIAKLLSNRIVAVASSLISSNQLAFVKGCLILDNHGLVVEMLCEFRQKNIRHRA